MACEPVDEVEQFGSLFGVLDPLVVAVAGVVPDQAVERPALDVVVGVLLPIVFGAAGLRRMKGS